MPVHVHDSITKLAPEDGGCVVIAASHGGRYPGYLAAKHELLGVVLSDAGVGLDEAGIGSLAYLDDFDIPAATVDYRSARIGDGADLATRGVISFCNRTARALGCAIGESARACAEKMCVAAPHATQAPRYDEARFLLHDAGVPVWGIDSISLVRNADAGTIVVSASHGGLLGGNAASAIGVRAFAALYNDAGIGIDEAGVSRLPALERDGIAGATVDAMSARIGDARSSWETGRISRINAIARAFGARPGMSVPEFCEYAARARGSRAPMTS